MVMGTTPFDDENLPNSTKKKIIGLAKQYDILNISANPSIPVALENLIFRLIASKPEDIKYRYNSIDEIINDAKHVMSVLNKTDDDTPLLKPLNDRIYRTGKKFLISKYKNNIPVYKRLWFFALITIVSLIILVVALVLFFII